MQPLCLCHCLSRTLLQALPRMHASMGRSSPQSAASSPGGERPRTAPGRGGTPDGGRRGGNRLQDLGSCLAERARNLQQIRSLIIGELYRLGLEEREIIADAEATADGCELRPPAELPPAAKD